ncbi:MAG TPA: choice-of-anchor D domain-containing protein [Candidatus Cloacimonadota bacterium]|nr:choice-of-anchor D domain-containing protein [Candidatus Cloacimonadota bacterium]
MKKLILLSLVMLMAVFAFADVITIGSGTNYTYEPIGSLWGFHRSAAIYTSVQVGGSGTINTISYKAYNTTTTVIPIKVYMKMTTAATLTPAVNWPTLISGLTPLYEGTISGTAAGAWSTITLTTPFAYTGNNLEILIESNYGGGGTSGPQWYYTSATGMNQYIRKDNTAPTTEVGSVTANRPNVQLDMSNYTVFAPSFAVNPTSVNFGIVNMNTTSAYTFVTVSNGGAGTLNITDLTLGGTNPERFVLDMNANPLPWALGSGLGKTIKVAFNPLAAQDYSATLNFTGDAKVDHQVALSGTGFDPIISSFPWNVNFGSTSTDWLPLNWTQLNGFISGTPTINGSQWAQDDWLNVSGTNKAAKSNIYGSSRNAWLVTPQINVPVETHELKFDAALMAWNGTAPATGTLADDRFLVVMSESPLMTNPTILREWNNTGSPYVLNSIPNTGMNYSIPLTGISGLKYFAFYAESTVSGNGDNDFMIDNVVIQLAPVTPAFGVTPEDKLFGTIAVNSAVQQAFTISNTGGGELQINSVSLNGDPQFTLVDSNSYPASLTNLPMTVTVVFNPIAEGNFSTTLTIVDNLSKASHDVIITGSGSDAANYGGGDATTTAGGYFFANNVSIAAPTTPAYSWVNETSNSVIETADQDDTAWGPFPLGFVFNYYGVNYSDVWVSSNGFVSFGSGSNAWTNSVLPNSSTPNNLIALFWDDLEYFAGTSNVYYGGNGSTFTITFDHFGRTGSAYDPLLSVTAQVILYADGRIKLQYNDIAGSLTGNFSATVGIENADGSKGIQYHKDGIGGPLATGTKAGGIAIMFGSSLMTLPVELSSFTAAPTAENYVNLTWITESETNLLGYRVYRNDTDNYSQSTLLTPVMLEATNSSTQHKYDFTDREVETEQVYYYWLESVDYSSTTVHGPVTVTVLGSETPNIPSVTMMRSAYPNPFKTGTTIALDVKEGETATVTIYNLAGQAVRSYKATQGSHTINWDGRDSKNQNCASGVYFYRLTSPSRNITKKMVMVK